MTYEYKLNDSMRSKYGFTHLLCNGWFGIYEDIFNLKYIEGDICNHVYNHGRYIIKNLSAEQIDEITTNSICIEQLD